MRLNPVLGDDMSVEKLSGILKGKLRSHPAVFKMVTDCYRSGGMPVMRGVQELTSFSSVVSVVHEAIVLQVFV